MKKSEVSYKLIMIGDSGVGKTSILMRYCQNTFQNDYLSTVGVDFKMKRVNIDGNQICFNIWDTAGQQRFRNITKSFYKNSHGIILVYCIDNLQSFNHIQNWIEQIRDNANNDIKLIIVANKCDLDNQRQVSKEKGEQLGRKYNIEIIEVSAKLDKNLNGMFQKLGRKILKQNDENLDEQDVSKKLDENKKSNKNVCCK